MAETPKSSEVLAYVCENCGRAGPITTFNDDCTPGWTHGRLHRIRQFEVTDEIVERLTADLLAETVEVVNRFNRPLRDRYLADLYEHVRGALERALSTQEVRDGA